MILTRTPLRVSFFGGGSDHPEHFIRHGGAVLGMAIDKYVYIGVKRMPPGQLHNGTPLRYRVQYSKVDDCQSVDEIRHPAVRAALLYLKIDEPLEFHIFGDLPGRSGLGGSSAFSVGCLHALLRLRHPKVELAPLDLAREAIAFEKFFLREAVGCQDQLFAALGGALHVQFGSAESIINQIEILDPRLAELEASLVLVYSGTMRDAAPLAARQAKAAPSNARALGALRDLAAEGAAVLRGDDSLDQIGELLNNAWYHKRGLCSDITSPAIDAFYSRGMWLGATGGKLLGAGGGGFMLFFVPQAKRDTFEAGIGAPCVRFNLASQGSTVIINEP